MTALLLDPATPPVDLLDSFGPHAPGPPPRTEDALAYVRALASSHYENFSVLSRLVPARLRDDFAAVYAFCRWADDLADQTGDTDHARARSVALLDWWRAELRACFEAALAPPTVGALQPRHPVFVALAPTIARHRLPLRPFEDLIDAFLQDQRVTRYDTWDQLLDYCARSANPVGRIVLHLAGFPDTPANADRYRMSDATCTALQLTNFWQDVRRDLIERDRVYLPRALTGLSADDLRAWVDQPDNAAARVRFIKALRPLVHRTADLFDQGAPLPALLPPDIRPVVWLFGAGGRSMLGAVEQAGCATLWVRPMLGTVRKASLVAQAWVRFRLRGEAQSSNR
jgi:squalene synthase HpnC